MSGRIRDEGELELMTAVASNTNVEPQLGLRGRRARRALIFALFAAAIAVGIALRFLQIEDQIIADDEWHSLHALLDNGYATIFTHFGISDHCIPLTLYDKLVSDTVGLSEWSMRAPMLLCGCLALVVLPWLFVDWLGAKNTLVFTWLLAISPLHVYFSRYARPYSIVFLLVVVGTAAFARWWSSGKIAWAIVFALCAILAPWFHMACLPFVVAPFACVLVLGMQRARRENRPLKSVLSRDVRPGFWWLAIAVAIGVGALIVPPLAIDWRSLAMRSGHYRFKVPSPADVYELSSGAQVPVLAFVAGVALLLGFVTLRRERRGLLAYFVIVPAAQIVALTISGPDKFDDAIVLVRYAFPMLAGFLWILVAGFEQLDALIRKEWKSAPPHAATICMCVALPLLGPIAQSYREPNNWTNAAMYQFNYSPRFERMYATSVLGIRSLPEIYMRLSRIDDPDMRIVEAPWNYEWNANPFPVYQTVHEKKMLMGFVDDAREPPGPGELPFGDARFHFHNFVHVGDFDALRRKKVHFVFLHRDAAVGPNRESEPRAAAVERWRLEYVERFGKPVFEDKTLSVFDLVRRH
jgi:hypothetical protein